MTTNNAYIQGFMNKCAEYGVNPQSLARRARARGMQKRSAGEYAGAVPPKKVVDLGTDDIPGYDPYLDYAGRLGRVNTSQVGTYAAQDEINDEIGARPYTDVAFETGAVDPKWWSAHTNATAQAVAPLKGLEPPLKLPEHIRQAVIKNYHDMMLSQTGMPERVSIPAHQSPSPLQRDGSRKMYDDILHNLFDKKLGLTR